MSAFASRFALACLVCLAAVGAAAAQDTPGVNDPPDVILPSPVPDAVPNTPISFSISVTDPDVGGGLMEMEIDISDLDGAGGRNAANGDYGRFTWGFGTNVTSDVALATRTALNIALANIIYTPPPGFAGLARMVFEIDDQGNTGTGGELSRTRFINIDICVPSELGTAACATNAPPDVQLPIGAISTASGVALIVPTVVSDVDAGVGLMEMEIDISDLDGVGGLSVPNGDYGTFSWSFGNGVTSDTAVASLEALNAALAGLTLTPNPTYTGTVRLVFEIDDQGNSGEGTVLSRTRFKDIATAPSGGEVRFARGCVATFGEGGTVSVPIERVNGITGAASVQVLAEGGTAQDGVDFTLSGASVAWAAGSAGVRNAQLQVGADGIAEATEHLLLLLDAPVAATLATPAVQTVFIRDVPGSLLIFASGLEGDCTP